AEESLFEELPDESEPPPAAFCTKRGAAMKLHISGLAAPMKARVVEGTANRVRVGSQLEFLTLGRALQLEDLSTARKQAAHIHSVSVEVDAETHIPQLVVTLRCGETADVTPEPTVVNSNRRERKRVDSEEEDDYVDDKTEPSRKRLWAAPKKPTAREPELDDDEEEDDDMDAAERLLKGRFAVWAMSASRGMQAMSVRVAAAPQGAPRLVRGWSPSRAFINSASRWVRRSHSSRVPQTARVARPRSATL